MKTEKYYDWKRGVPITEQDGCSYERWMEGNATASFGHLSDNIYLFLRSQEIERYDKYASGVFDIDLDTGAQFHEMRKDTTLLLLDQFKRLNGKLTRVLDIGCGLGYILRAVGQHFPNVELTGLEISIAALRRAAEQIPKVDFVLADAHELPFSPGYFDAILLNNVIEHVDSPKLLFMQLRRAIAPNGCLIISTPSRYRFENLVRVIMGQPVLFMSNDHVAEYSVGQIKALLQGSGYEVLQVLGPKRKPKRWTARNTVSHFVIKPPLRAWLSALKSHHVIDTTAFYLAKKMDANF